MEYSKDNDGLREPLINRTSNPVPLFIQEVNATSSQFPTYEPSGPGVYSAILEYDKANNSKYARQIAIFDKTSDISISTDYLLYVSSDSPSTNHTWQSDQFAKIDVIWNKHFFNELQENEHFLARILDYAPRLDDGKSGRRHFYHCLTTKTAGARNISAIPNINSIVRFDTAFGLTNLITPSSEWIVVAPLRDQKSFLLIDIRDGDSRQVWVRAYDIMGNTKVDSTIVHFDRSTPKIYPSSMFIHNVDDDIYPFSSRVLVSAEDPHSSVRKVSVRFIVNGTGEMKANKIL